ncbi:four-carbon acid sugar kinase family protein [Dinghuibacter silviterrae]|uniref:Uncharacterized protein YgbK (DUF1537 family) n=1 Tax=Dinghuibacter silviterrae TaxID=1539049 RepID=A0A4R8DV97_9BACT|nr:four-carbon acid sugar kinase family protein [Dinghuibacter silviterrae]TDX01395.1 uncharacterized protein YgbK (DUF1537 family) [Dinghuibacter silviterrae]
MIAVIADDFTGAAELGGVALRYDLSVEIHTEVNPACKADVLIIASDTRAMNEEDAMHEMKRITEAVAPLRPQLIFKKVDSVLRGHVAAEMEVQMRVLGFSKALLVPANPVLGRTIRNGLYYLQGQPIHHSGFSQDPEYAITSARIHDMLRIPEGKIPVRKLSDDLPLTGIVVGEAEIASDLQDWARRIDGETLVAGASGFFAAVLDSLHVRGVADTHYREPAGKPCLFVCGSAYAQSLETIRTLEERGGPVSYMPLSLASTEDLDSLEDWVEEVRELIEEFGVAIIAIRGGETHLVSPSALRERTALLVQQVCARESIRELFIEGGSTARTILERLDLQTFVPVEEKAAGVIRMRMPEHPGLHVTVKPGSYSWPALSML